MELPAKFSRESFSGFDMLDEEVPSGSCRSIAIGLKHIFENLVKEADQKNEEFFLTPEVEHALRRLLIDPSDASLQHLFEMSPAIRDALFSFTEAADIPPPSSLDEEQSRFSTTFTQDVLAHASHELAYLLEIGREHDKVAGGSSYWQPDVHFALTKFLKYPTSTNAHLLLEAAPIFDHFFSKDS